VAAIHPNGQGERDLANLKIVSNASKIDYNATKLVSNASKTKTYGEKLTLFGILLS
jgi:hypothetical protein